MRVMESTVCMRRRVFMENLKKPQEYVNEAFLAAGPGDLRTLTDNHRIYLKAMKRLQQDAFYAGVKEGKDGEGTK